MAPNGYEPVKQKKDVDLDGKEVYLAQIPADFDIKKAVIKSDTEVMYNGTPYFMMSSTPLSNCDILTASKDGKLRPSSTRLTGLLAFTKQVPKLKIDHEKEAQPKPLVEQKDNLRMRHFPTGYGPKSYGISTSLSKPAKKRAEEQTEGEKDVSQHDGDESKPQKKKHKKDKTEKSEKKKKSDKKSKSS